MSMQANILRDAQGNITVHIEGDMDYDNSIPLREQLHHLVNDNPFAKITIDLSSIDLIGASGICHFVETVEIINQKKQTHNKLQVANIQDDFKKVFQLYTTDKESVFWDEFAMDNDDTSSLNQQFGNRKRTFQN